MDFFPHTVFVILGLFILRLVIKKYEERQQIEQTEVKRKKELTRLVVNQQDRELQEEFSEEEFWRMVEIAGARAGSSYKNFLGVFKDLITKKSPTELLMLDNLTIRIYKEHISYDLLAASAIIFKNQEFSAVYVLMNILFSRGEVFFKNACHNPSLIIGKQFDDINSSIINDLIAELYLIKTQQLIPLPPEEEFQISGEKWKSQELPLRYPELWEAYS